MLNVETSWRDIANATLPQFGTAFILGGMNDEEGVDTSSLGENIRAIPTGIRAVKTPQEIIFLYDSRRGGAKVWQLENPEQRRQKIQEVQGDGFIVMPSSWDRVIGYRRRQDEEVLRAQDPHDFYHL